MNKQDAEFRKKLLATFAVEAEEHVQGLSAGLVGLEEATAPDERLAIVEEIFRGAHSLKGASRAVDLVGIEAVCQALEGVFAAMKHGELDPSKRLFDVLHSAIDKLSGVLSAAEGQQEDLGEDRVSEIVGGLGLWAAGEAPAEDETLDVAPPIFPDAPELMTIDEPVGRDTAPASPGPETETVRIYTTRLVALFRQSQEMLAAKASTAQRAADLREVMTLLDKWRREWRKVSPAVQSVRRDFIDRESGGREDDAHGRLRALLEFLEWNDTHSRLLEGKLVPLAHVAEHDSHTLSRTVDELVDDARQTLMLPFNSLVDALRKVVRDLARDMNKEVEFVVNGGETEIDRRILQEMKDPLVHMLRNAIDHGIEEPSLRKQGEKPARGRISIDISQLAGNKVQILVSDDGAGIDLEKVTESALKIGAISEEAAANLSPRDAVLLVLLSEVSASSFVTDVSGRGLGLAVVEDKVDKLRGTISVSTEPGRGSSFSILLPSTLATARGILVQSAGEMFLIPTADVERAVRIRAEEVTTVQNTETTVLNGETIPFGHLHRLLGIAPSSPAGTNGSLTPCLVLRAGEDRMAIGLDEILEEQEVLVKNLGPQLSRVRNVSGAAAIGSGQVVLILHVADLIKAAMLGVSEQVRDVAVVESLPGRKQRHSLLVIDDSITARTLLKNILEMAGYEVQTASDGLDALSTLKSEQFDLIVTDLEMPRMNGFDLTAKIRRDKELADIPVVLVTGLESPADRKRGLAAGADAYIVKSSFDQSNLLEVIRRLI